MREATLCFLMKETNGGKALLLAMKKKGFGQRKWNGVGGRFDPEKDRNIIETAKRELREEIGVTTKEIKEMAILKFSYPYLSDPEEKEWQVHVFFAKKWQGEPKETEEMKPRWFKTNEIPFNQMWPDDKFWLPRILRGDKLKAEFVFKPGELIDSYGIKTI
jgi:8-oxo-dGTP diphosphatase/2-hydroxy-dATP diphosphatase